MTGLALLFATVLPLMTIGTVLTTTVLGFLNFERSTIHDPLTSGLRPLTSSLKKFSTSVPPSLKYSYFYTINRIE